MKLNRQSVIALALVAVVGLGLIGAYANACDNEKTAQKASNETCTAASAAACQAAKASHASAGGACCAAKEGATQASAKEGGAAVVPVGTGAACGQADKTMKMSAGACPHATGAMAAGGHCAFEAAENCDGCRLYKTYWTSLENAERDIATLSNGIVVHLASSDPAVAAELQKYAAEKAALYKQASSKSYKGHLCDFCKEKVASMKGASFQVSNSTNGVFTVITSQTKGTVENLHKIAAAETSSQAKVEG